MLYQVLFRIFHSSSWTTNLIISKEWFSNFLHHGILYYRFIFGGSLSPQTLYHPNVPFLYSSVLVLSVVPAPSSKIPWLLLLMPLVTSSPRFLYGGLLLITASGWEALELALHVLRLPWVWKAGGGWLKCGVGSAEGW